MVWRIQLVFVLDSVTRNLIKNSPNNWKNAKISTLKLNLKVQNINIKPHSKPLKTYKKSCVENACLGENWLSKKCSLKLPKWQNFTQSGHTGLRLDYF